MNSIALGAVIVLGAAGAAYTLQNLSEDIAMEGQHWIMLVIILIAGYVLGRLWVTPAQMVGLP